MKLFIFSLALNLITFTANAAVEDSEENYSDYNQIINELESSTKVEKPSYFLSDNKLHFGAGYSNSLVKLSGSEYANSVSLQGFQIGFGMDFTPNFITEISYTNFTPETKGGKEYSLAEYGIRGIFRSHMTQVLAGRLGFGIASRNLEIAGREFSDPVSQVFGGLEAKFGPRASIITEIAYKDSFVNDTPERSALDLSVRIDGHF